MNKKLLALMITLTIGPVFGTFAADDKALHDETTLNRMLYKSGLTVHNDHRCTLNLCTATIPAAALLTSLGILGYKIYKDSDGTWTAIKKCFSKEAGEVWEKDKTISITTYLSALALLSFAGNGIYNKFRARTDKECNDDMARLGAVDTSKYTKEELAAHNKLVKDLKEEKAKLAKPKGDDKKKSTT